MKTLFLVLGFHIIVQYAEAKGMYVLPLSKKKLIYFNFKYVLITNVATLIRRERTSYTSLILLQD